MTIDRARRITFEEVADLYSEVRPGYPEPLIEEILTLSGLPPEGRILEIGCGPGNATLPFARRGYRILGIELGPRLAALAAQRCRDYPGVAIQCADFETCPLEDAAFDLALSADALHWIPPQIAYPKIARVLKPSGSAALIWNVSVYPNTEWAQAVDAVYGAVAPELENPDRGLPVEWLIDVITGNFSRSECFGPVTFRQYPWILTVSTERYLGLLSTFSGHHGIAKPLRETLYAGIREVLERFGGQVDLPQLTVLFHAHVTAPCPMVRLSGTAHPSPIGGHHEKSHRYRRHLLPGPRSRRAARLVPTTPGP